MINTRALAFSLAIFAANVTLAETCPSAPDHNVALTQLIERIQQAPDERSARVLSDQMWALWADAPDEASQELLDKGMARRSSYDLLGARTNFDRLVEYCPEYAEGYNQRAFVSFLSGDFEGALVDLDRALALSPRHIAALSGKALSLMGAGRMDEARTVLEAAMAMNPWLPERGLAAPGGPLAPVDQDI